MSSKRCSGAFFSTAALLILVPALCTHAHAAKKPAAVVAVLRFADAAGGPRAAHVQSLIADAARRGRLFGLPAADPGAVWYPFPAGDALTPQGLARYREIGSKLKSTHLMIGRITARDGIAAIEARLFSVAEGEFLPALVEPAANADFRAAATSLAARTARLLAGTLPCVTGLIVSRGTSFTHVALAWKGCVRGSVYTIERAPYQRGPWTLLGTTDRLKFEDDGADEGLLSWYRVSSWKDGLSGTTMEGSGYRKPANPRGLTVDEVMATRTKPWPTPATEAEREAEERHLPLFKKYYESYFMMSFIFLVGRIYVNSGELLVYRDLPRYQLDPANRTVYFSRPGVFTVKFYSRRFYRFLRDMYYMNIPFDELLPRVMANSYLFCVRTGETEARRPDGRIRYLPNFEAVGMGTEYHRDYVKWRGNSIVFATSDEELYKRIRQAQLKGY
jgi:hypothetical protein